MQTASVIFKVLGLIASAVAILLILLMIAALNSAGSTGTGALEAVAPFHPAVVGMALLLGGGFYVCGVILGIVGRRSAGRKPRSFPVGPGRDGHLTEKGP